MTVMQVTVAFPVVLDFVGLPRSQIYILTNYEINDIIIHCFFSRKLTRSTKSITLQLHKLMNII